MQGWRGQIQACFLQSPPTPKVLLLKADGGLYEWESVSGPRVLHRSRIGLGCQVEDFGLPQDYVDGLRGLRQEGGGVWW